VGLWSSISVAVERAVIEEASACGRATTSTAKCRSPADCSPEAILCSRPARDDEQQFPASSANSVQRTDLSVVIREQIFEKVFTISAGSCPLVLEGCHEFAFLQA